MTVTIQQAHITEGVFNLSLKSYAFRPAAIIRNHITFYQRLLKSIQSVRLKQNSKYKIENYRKVVTYKLYTIIFQHSYVVINTENALYFMLPCVVFTFHYNPLRSTYYIWSFYKLWLRSNYHQEYKYIYYLLLLILQSFDWLAAFHLELLQFIAV